MRTTFEDAVEAYQKYCEANALIFSQPSESLSDVTRRYVLLRNTNGHLARYEISTGTILVP